MKFSCCIEMIYTTAPFAQRIEKAANAGFDYFEFWNWNDKDIDAIEAAKQAANIGLSIFQGSQNGVLVDKNDNDTYIADVKRSIDLAKRLGAKAVFCMSDIMQEDRSVKPHPYPISAEAARDNSIQVLKQLAPYAQQAEVKLVIEPLNTKVDHAGYSLSGTEAGIEIIKGVNSPFVQLLYDAYHMQIMEGDIIETIKKYSGYIGHFHIADVPGRNQPGVGELNYTNILKALKATGYDGAVGFEFTPLGRPDEEVVAETLAMCKAL